MRTCWIYIIRIIFTIKKTTALFSLISFFKGKADENKANSQKRCVLECETGQKYFDFDNDCKVGVLEGGKGN